MHPCLVNKWSIVLFCQFVYTSTSVFLFLLLYHSLSRSRLKYLAFSYPSLPLIYSLCPLLPSIPSSSFLHFSFHTFHFLVLSFFPFIHSSHSSSLHPSPFLHPFFSPFLLPSPSAHPSFSPFFPPPLSHFFPCLYLPVSSHPRPTHAHTLCTREYTPLRQSKVPIFCVAVSGGSLSTPEISDGSLDKKLLLGSWSVYYVGNGRIDSFF